MSDIIPIDSEITTFSDYLDHNCRCILSARFGDGKSFFLKEFKEKTSDKYIFLTIYPVNYQVAENKDIFEYIKRDILLQILMISAIDLSDEKYGFALRLWGFLNQKGKDLVSDIVELVTTSLANIPQTSMTILRDNIAKFKEFSKKINKSESDSIESYLNEFTRQKGGIYEFDPISQIIYQLITGLKTQNGKQVVLVIEDMDRIDPAHIFRILNVFSAHWDIRDYSEQKYTAGDPLNKYNFDKILMVCHFQNIKNIFHHFYGEKTDFTGYIHKFSTSAPYEYSLNDVIEEWLMNKIQFNKELYPDICKQLVVLILRKYENEEDIITNIRHITSFLTQTNYNIRTEYVPSINLQNNTNYCISTYNQVTVLLSILKNFGLSIDEFITCNDVDINDFQLQLYVFIAQCWLIPPYIGTNSMAKHEIHFSNYYDGKSTIECTFGQQSCSLQCKAQEVSTNPPHHYNHYYEIKYLQMRNSIHTKFTLKECKIVLNFFMNYIY